MNWRRAIFAFFISAVSVIVWFTNVARADDATGHGVPPPSIALSQAPLQGGMIQGALNTAKQSLTDEADRQADRLPVERIDQFWQDLERNYGDYLPELSGESIVHAVLQNGGPTLPNILHGLVRYFFRETLDNAALLGGLLILAVLAAVLESMQTAFESQTVSQIAYAVVFLVLTLIAIASFTEAIGFARHAIQTMNNFMLATLPLAVTLLAASGAIASAAFFQPMLVFAVHFVSNLVFYLVFPLIFFSAVLDVTSTLSSRYQLTRLASLLRGFGVGALGILLSGFLGVTAVQGAGKGVADGIMLRAAKTGVSTFVPVIGKAVSDAAETVLSASLLVKNAVGIAGLIILSLLAIFPALKILALSVIYSGSAALIQPLGENQLVACLGTLGKSMILVFACVAAVGLMFFIAICILLASANLAVMIA